ncbi:DUF2971 domain-containing protein [Ochrobactrum sp. 19YEA23]|uniref:DUF2971 domain-containing protein n=1 Tax=Ochrobactrum sp. 19YEA23 TaxID=3039854 RepID=UPI00247AAD9E
MMMEGQLDRQKITEIFLPTLHEALQRMDSNNLKLAHYTRFENAKLIISGRTVWMRGSDKMNDTREITHGIEAVDYALTKYKHLTKETLSRFYVGLPAILEKSWFDLRNRVLRDVFISCFSEHWPHETPMGRLSMWREYGKPDGVALVLNVEPFRLETNALNAYASPVYYGGKNELANKYEEILINISDNTRELKEFSNPSHILQLMTMAILFGASCLKHSIFKEEEEWRVLHMTNIQMPTLLRKRVVPITNETVFEIPLEDCPEKGLVGLTPDAILANVIFGPSKRADENITEMIDLLRLQGVREPHLRILKSEIPLRVD